MVYHRLFTHWPDVFSPVFCWDLFHPNGDLFSAEASFQKSTNFLAASVLSMALLTFVQVNSSDVIPGFVFNQSKKNVK